MIISELVSLLGFKVDPGGAAQFDGLMLRARNSANSTASHIENVFLGVGVAITAAIGGAFAAGVPIAQAGDAMQGALAKIESSIGRSATSAAEAAALYQNLHEVGQLTGVGADESAGAFTRFNLAMQDLNRPATDTIKLIEGIQAAGIIAGTTTSELTATMLQLGQALGSGKLQGEELNSLRENMPRFLRDVMKSMNMTSEAFFKAAEKGELKPDRLIPAFLAASETARAELANFPMTMGRAYKALTNSATRFLAELDKQLGLSKAVASVFMTISRTLESWRGGLSIIGDWVRALGGLEGIARLAGIALLVAFGPTLLASIFSLSGAFMTLGRLILTSLLPLAGFAAWVLIIEDFFGWMQGKNSLFGEKFGDFASIIDPIKTKLNEFKDWFVGIPAAIAETWNNGISGMKPQIDWLIGVGASLMQAFQPLKEFFSGVLDHIIAKFQAFYDKVVGVINGIRSILPSMEGSGPVRPGEVPDGMADRARRRLSIDPTGLGGTLPDVSGRLNGAPVSNNQANTITNEITVNAPGADPASVAAGTQAGMARATESMTNRLGNSLALGLGMANPRIESAAQ